MRPRSLAAHARFLRAHAEKPRIDLLAQAARGFAIRNVEIDSVPADEDFAGSQCLDMLDAAYAELDTKLVDTLR
jgi:hypothetical protein